MDEMTMCNVKEVKDEHHRELSLDSAVPLGSTECFDLFQLIQSGAAA